MFFVFFPRPCILVIVCKLTLSPCNCVTAIEPNVRGDGDNEGYCSESTIFWNGDGTVLQCADLGLAPGQRHEFCRGNDPTCVGSQPYQDCVRGPNECFNADAVTQYDSEINALVELGVERLSIGVGNESRVEWGSAL